MLVFFGGSRHKVFCSAMEMARTTSVPGDEDKITILAITELIKPECLSQWPILGHFDREPSIADFGT
jgi:hypothetical protein